jgi:hypothetical protein
MNKSGLSERGRYPARQAGAPGAGNPAVPSAVRAKPRLPRLHKASLILGLRRALALVTVLAATFAGSYLVLVGYHRQDTLTVGEIRESVSPGHRGAIDVYVPLVDWGARFEAITLPVRLRVDLQTVNRDTAAELAGGGSLNVEQVRDEARDALAAYLKRLIALMVLCGAALGVLTAFAIRSRALRLRWTIGLAVAGAAVGFIVGTLIPKTSAENRALGPLSDQVSDKAKEAAHESLERGKAVAQDALEAATDTLQERGQEEAQQMSSSLQDKAQAIRENA